MVFNSFAFLLYFPIVLLLYRILPLKARWVMLLAVSLMFYMSWQADLIYLIGFTTAVSYLCALMIEKYEGERKKQKFFMLVAVIASLAVLFFFKYFNFLAESVSDLLNLIGISAPDMTLELILPVGISFYTFQTLSYVIDVYRGSIKAESHFGYYALYVSFFPQLVAGPIERPENLLPQLKTKNPFNVNDTIVGLKFMMVGFFKKIAVADQLSKYVDIVYNNADTVNSELVNGFTVILATVMFTIQIYCDFSGYTDIAIGCSRVMGIRLMQNFNDPFSATSIKDFWRRWHISLTSWFTDYIYIPLGGSRCSRAKHFRNIMIVFLVSGFWHGAAWTYVLWGVVHGVYQIVGKLTSEPRSRLLARMGVNENGAVMTWLRRIGTFALVSLAFMIFRANSMYDLKVLFTTVFTGWGNFSFGAAFGAIGMDAIGLITTVLSVILLRALDTQINTVPDMDGSETLLDPSRASACVCVCWSIAAAWLILLSSDVASSFIYFQF